MRQEKIFSKMRLPFFNSSINSENVAFRGCKDEK